ncbi:hypothetical protein EB796_009225 [Bugula neritina]|uniref:Uncharacterized protein n=1 Tax=Bugula neritina TaxID=10212 RepID=A0A7J7K362_BUGNE|nr:hypothetical protein EB796_009225 [Bugula neritina]
MYLSSSTLLYYSFIELQELSLQMIVFRCGSTGRHKVSLSGLYFRCGSTGRHKVSLSGLYFRQTLALL